MLVVLESGEHSRVRVLILSSPPTCGTTDVDIVIKHGALIVLELLADAPELASGRVQPLPIDGTISALNIPHSTIVFDLHQVAEIKAELLGDDHVAAERIKHADVISFTCLKAFAFDLRFARKDAHDLIYCLDHAPDGADAVAQAYRQREASDSIEKLLTRIEYR